MVGDEFLLSGDTTIALASGQGNRVQEFTPAGKLLHERRSPPQGLPSNLNHGTIDWWTSFRRSASNGAPAREGRVSPVIRWCVARSCSHIVLHESDPVLLAVNEAAPPGGSGAYPAFGSSGQRFVVGDGFSYTLWMFRMGDTLSPRRIERRIPPRMATAREIARAESSWVEMERRGMPGPRGTLVRPDFSDQRRNLQQQPRMHFQYGGISFDGHRRMWVIGRANDSTFLDVFADTVFLGRRMVDCRRMAYAGAVRGSWLALGCQADDDLERPYQIRRFRIVEP